MTAALSALLPLALAPAPPPALQRSDVVFMYQAASGVYADYGATVLGWGGTPTPQSLQEARGVRFFGSVGMVTEFARFRDRFPNTWRGSLCQDVHGKPVKVPWLVDHQHKGEPYWWCCTRQPDFRTYLRERVAETVRAGAAGLHIDDHLGTAGGMWLGICFCDRCVEGFRAHLQALPAGERETLGIGDASGYDFRAAVRQWLAAPGGGREVTRHPLWTPFSAYQYRAAAELIQELRALAAQTAGKALPVGVNAGLLWPGHLATYRAVDLFSAETDHHAGTRALNDSALLAYRLAEATGRPYAATASGADWAAVKAQNMPGLARGWIALAYASGQLFMAPHRQWCHTPQLGTHWYDGPAERFAPLYRFVRAHADLLDGWDTYADVAVVMPHASYRSSPERWAELNARLAAANISYRLMLGGDAVADADLDPRALARAAAVTVLDPGLLSPEDGRRWDARARRGGVVSPQDVATRVAPAVRVEAAGAVRALPRVSRRGAVIHLLSRDYDAARDDVRATGPVRVTLDRRALGIEGRVRCRLVRPDGEDVPVALDGSVAVVPRVGLWALLVVERSSAR